MVTRMATIRIPGMPTMPDMGTRKTNKPKPGKYKPHRVTRVPERLAELLQQCADEDGERFTWEVREAVRMYLRHRGKMPPKPD